MQLTDNTQHTKQLVNYLTKDISPSILNDLQVNDLVQINQLQKKFRETNFEKYPMLLKSSLHKILKENFEISTFLEAIGNDLQKISEEDIIDSISKGSSKIPKVIEYINQLEQWLGDENIKENDFFLLFLKTLLEEVKKELNQKGIVSKIDIANIAKHGLSIAVDYVTKGDTQTKIGRITHNIYKSILIIADRQRDSKTGLVTTNLKQLRETYSRITQSKINDNDIRASLYRLTRATFRVEWWEDKRHIRATIPVLHALIEETSGGMRKVSEESVILSEKREKIIKIQFIIDKFLLQQFEGNNGGYVKLIIDGYAEVMKKRNNRQKVLIDSLTSESKIYRIFSQEELEKIYDFRKWGMKQINDDIEELISIKIFADKENGTGLRTYQKKDGFYLYAIKGEAINSFTLSKQIEKQIMNTKDSLFPKKIEKTKESIEMNSMILDFEKVRKEITHHSLEEVVNILKRDLTWISSTKDIAKGEYKISTKATLWKKLREKRFSKIEQEVMQLYINTYSGNKHKYLE